MLHIRCFKENNEFDEYYTLMRDFFKDKINYKFLNDLTDYCTEYEDVEYDISIEVSVNNRDNEYLHYCDLCPIYWDGEFQKFTDLTARGDFNMIYMKYLRSGLIYSIQVYKDTNQIDRYEKFNEILLKIISRIQSKYEIEPISDCENLSFLYFKLSGKK